MFFLCVEQRELGEDLAKEICNFQYSFLKWFCFLYITRNKYNALILK